MPSRRRLPLTLPLLLVVVVAASQLGGVGSQRPASKPSGKAAAKAKRYDVVVLGASAGGVGAAIAAGREGASVVLVEDTVRLGGMMSNGVTTDVSRPESINGLYAEWVELNRAHYAARGQLEQTRNGIDSEPDVAEALVRRMVRAAPGVTLMQGYHLKEHTGVVRSTVGGRPRVTGIRVQNARGASVTLEGAVFIDATDAGDLLGQVGRRGVDWVVGREARSPEEPYAGEFFEMEQGRPTGSGAGDRRVQAYNYRMTFQLDGRPVRRPRGYQHFVDTYERATHNPDGSRLSLPDKYSCTIAGMRFTGIRVQRCLPNNKIDINIDLLGVNHAYPTATLAQRARIARLHRDFQLGYLYYLRTELGAKEPQYARLGLSTDDYDTTGYFPASLYVREARRMVGMYRFSQPDAVTDEVRPKRKADSIAVGDYGADSHCVQWIQDRCEGGYWVPTKPYQIPYGVIVPRTIDGLLVPVAASATHVAYSTLRMEPVRMALGQAAGTAAALAVRGGIQPREVDTRQLQRRLVRQRQTTTFFTDVHGGDPAFEAVQMLASRGVVDGYDDHSFRPTATASRAAMAKTIALGLGLDTAGPFTQHFADVPPGHPSFPYVEALYARGAVSGTPGGSFSPDGPATRAQLAKVLAIAGSIPTDGRGVQHFSDVPPSHWAFGYIEALHTRGITQGTSKDTFAPDAPLTRAHLAMFVDRTRP